MLLRRRGVEELSVARHEWVVMVDALARDDRRDVVCDVCCPDGV
jgi:hypothetical protein